MTKVKTKDMYTIGEASKICHISRKTLRFYEELGLITPDYVCPTNGYRYYTADTVQLLPILKYYKQMGFKLQEMTNIGDITDFYYHQRNFLIKLEELKKQEEQIQNCYEAVSDWLGMINEGTAALENVAGNVNLRYMELDHFYYLEQNFHYDYKESIINIPWINYLEKANSEITGPVILEFPSFNQKADGSCTSATILQKAVRHDHRQLPMKEYGGKMAISCYHVGDHTTLRKGYQKIEAWAYENGYQLEGSCYERYLIDYWATKDSSKFVTEILAPAHKIL